MKNALFAALLLAMTGCSQLPRGVHNYPYEEVNARLSHSARTRLPLTTVMVDNGATHLSAHTTLPAKGRVKVATAASGALVVLYEMALQDERYMLYVLDETETSVLVGHGKHREGIIRFEPLTKETDVLFIPPTNGVMAGIGNRQVRFPFGMTQHENTSESRLEVDGIAFTLVLKRVDPFLPEVLAGFLYRKPPDAAPVLWAVGQAQRNPYQPQTWAFIPILHARDEPPSVR